MAYRPDTDRASGVHCGWGRRISFKIGGNLIYDCFFYYVGEQLESLIGKGKSPAQQAAGARILLKADVSEATGGATAKSLRHLGSAPRSLSGLSLTAPKPQANTKNES